MVKLLLITTLESFISEEFDWKLILLLPWAAVLSPSVDKVNILFSLSGCFCSVWGFFLFFWQRISAVCLTVPYICVKAWWMQHVVNRTNRINENPCDKFTRSINAWPLFKEVSPREKKNPPFYAKQRDKWGFLHWIMVQFVRDFVLWYIYL